MNRRITLLLSSIVAGAIGILGMTPMASASVSAPHSPAGHHVTVINLQSAYQAQLAHPHKQGPIAGISYAPGKQPKAARSGNACTEPHCPMS